MGTLKEYYDADFNHAIRVHANFNASGALIEGAVLFDLAGLNAFVIAYFPDSTVSIDFIKEFLQSLKFGESKYNFADKITLPKVSEFPGSLEIRTKETFSIIGEYFGDPEKISISEITASRRIFIYVEKDFSIDDIKNIKSYASDLNLKVQFRGKTYMEERSRHEKPLAFICHDSRDKDDVAKKVANNLRRMLCPVWYDEYSLNVGDNLRVSIEKGIKECKKCILILSPNFFSNGGWTKTEFDSIFSRQIIEQKSLVLPIWYNVVKEDVYKYSPSLALIVGLDLNKLGEDKVCRELHKAIMS